jgi:hypothetical protein
MFQIRRYFWTLDIGLLHYNTQISAWLALSCLSLVHLGTLLRLAVVVEVHAFRKLLEHLFLMLCCCDRLSCHSRLSLGLLAQKLPLLGLESLVTVIHIVLVKVCTICAILVDCLIQFLRCGVDD